MESSSTQIGREWMERETFDFREMSSGYAKLNASRGPLLAVTSVGFAILALAAGWVLVEGPSAGGRTGLWWFGAIGATVACASFSIAMAILASRSTDGVTHLELSDEEVVFSRPPKLVVRLLWTDGRTRFSLRDVRGWSPTWPNGKPRTFDYLLSVRGFPLSPIPAEASAALVRAARAKGLKVTGWSEAPPSNGSTRKVIFYTT